MTRPQIIRADTIDLQNQEAPSAKDHTRHPAPSTAGPTAPHQAETLREVAAEANEQQTRSPRVSNEWTDIDEGSQDYTDNKTSPERTQNGGLAENTSEDAEMADAEGDDGLEDDDDMMDKISSSPSIDDGGYSLPKSWPPRVDSLSQVGTPPTSISFLGSSERSSSPFVETPVHYPLLSFREEQSGTGPYHPYRYNVVSARLASKIEASGDIESYSVYENKGDQKAAVGMADVSDIFDDEERDRLTPLPDDCIDNYDDDFDVGTALNNLAVQEDFGYNRHVYDDDECDERAMTIPYESSEEDDGHDLPYPEDPRMVDSGWGGDCLQDIEDIDFEFVYALHTFVATVEGQANATKGDTMVLLDDSNSYWWLVRIVKDSSIGYLPAEHIETPTERLARLNKHRNIDLSATMLGDQADKPKNPLKKAMRRRNAKTVQFAPPTYVEASDNDYSSDEDDEEAEYFAQQQQIDYRSELDEDESAVVEPLSVKSQNLKAGAEGDDSESTSMVNSNAARTSNEISDGKSDGSGRSRNGTVRNTDSFFKDDSVETRKITITPALFRDDSSTSTRTSNDSKELRQRPSLDKVDSEAVPEKGKDDKKKKEKKSGLLGNIFRRKDKKSKSHDDDPDELIYGKKSSEEPRASPDLDNEDIGDLAQASEPVPPEQSPQRHALKLEKQQRQEAPHVDNKQTVLVSPKNLEPQQIALSESAPPAVSSAEPSMRIVTPEEVETPAQQIRAVTPESSRTPSAVQSPQDGSRTTNTFTRIMRSASGSEAKPEKVKKAKSRIELDDFDSSAEASPAEELTEEPEEVPVEEPVITPIQRPIPGAFPDSYMSIAPTEKPDTTMERLSESPVQVSPVSNPPALVVDTSSQDEVSSPVSSPSPEIVDIESREGKASERSVSASTPTPTWNDTHLRTFFDDDGDIKDLLVVVYDKSGVEPAGPDHPLIGNLFKEEHAKLAEITTRLDSMLGDWLARKSRSTTQ